MHGPLNVKFAEIPINRDSSGSGWGSVASWCEHRRTLWLQKMRGVSWLCDELWLWV